MSFGMITTVASLPCSPTIMIHIFQHQHFQSMSSISSPSTRSLTKIATGIATQFDGLNYIHLKQLGDLIPQLQSKQTHGLVDISP